jgi:hypothetical protein
VPTVAEEQGRSAPGLRRGEERRRILTGSSAAPSISARPPPAPSIPAPFAAAFSSPARGDSEQRPWQLELGWMELGGQREASPVVERHSPRRRGPVNRRRRELPCRLRGRVHLARIGALPCSPRPCGGD